MCSCSSFFAFLIFTCGLLQVEAQTSLDETVSAQLEESRVAMRAAHELQVRAEAALLGESAARARAEKTLATEVEARRVAERALAEVTEARARAEEAQQPTERALAEATEAMINTETSLVAAAKELTRLRATPVSLLSPSFSFSLALSVLIFALAVCQLRC